MGVYAAMRGRSSGCHVRATGTAIRPARLPMEPGRFGHTPDGLLLTGASGLTRQPETLFGVRGQQKSAPSVRCPGAGGVAMLLDHNQFVVKSQSKKFSTK